MESESGDIVRSRDSERTAAPGPWPAGAPERRGALRPRLGEAAVDGPDAVGQKRESDAERVVGQAQGAQVRDARLARQDADRRLFARMVRTWQYAAYAGRLPSDAEFQALLDDLRQQYGWAA